MKTISATAIVALMTVSVGLAAAAPAMAQQAQPRFQQHMQHQGWGGNNQGNTMRPNRDGAGLGGLLAFGRDSERLEIALVRLTHAIDLTDEQKTLLESFKTDALAAQADFTKVVEANRPDAPAAGAPRQRPDIVARLDQRIALEQAHVAALTAVQPSFQAFIASLTDEQKAQLMPQREERTGWQGQRHQGPMGQQGQGPMGHHGKRPMPGQLDAPGAPPAPAEETAPLKS
ncbi:MAG: hypothetical protein JWR51_2127 [Devosia sp.]|uniref:Spy/CpxP family protein refolding chaperone n=1 Tax=Devosia sp. TaxID=1871048 RepID=UPI002624F613|nr:Spy/CpxP family protein refolding chaperone [Devosia sp.]MDB5529024.1 hypothetical protein [Devosia sp.]